MKRIPSILMFNIDRSRDTASTSAASSNKDSSPIRFSSILHLGNRTYLLTHILVHWGTSSTRGHYTCFAKSDPSSRIDNKWTHHDDARTKEMSFIDVRKFCTSQVDKTVSLFIYEQFS